MKYKIKIRIYSPGGRGKETTKIVLEKAKTSDLLDLLSHVRLFSTSWTVTDSVTKKKSILYYIPVNAKYTLLGIIETKVLQNDA